jgi:hypothetical protein
MAVAVTATELGQEPIMGNTNTRTRTVARRVAAFLALLGALVLSSGVALMATATAATAGDHGGDDEKKVNVCHATDSDTSPFQYLNISKNAVKDNGHLAHRQTPNKIWKTDGTWNGAHHSAGDPKPDLIQDFDGNTYDGNVTEALCDKHGTVDPATASVQWTDPSCDNENTASYDTNGDHVTWSIVEGSAVPGGHIKLKASVVPGYELSGPGDHHKRYFEHTFADAADCTASDATAEVTWTEPSCQNENTAGFDPNGNFVSFKITDGEVGPGKTVEITATADKGHAFADDKTTKVFTHTFDEAEVCIQFDATASVEWVEPSCQNENTPNYLPTGEHVTWEITDGSLTPDGDVEVTAIADPLHAFDNEATKKVFTHHFDQAEICEIVNPPREVTPDEPTFVEPTCDTEPGVTLPQPKVVLDDRARQTAGPVVDTSDADGIHYEATGDLLPGGTVEVDATLVDPETTFFGEGAVTHWSHTFAVPEGCTVVSPPVVTPPTSTAGTHASVVTPTVVEAGLAGSVATDLRMEQGRALAYAGLVLLLAAGGLGLVRRRI